MKLKNARYRWIIPGRDEETRARIIQEAKDQGWEDAIDVRNRHEYIGTATSSSFGTMNFQPLFDEVEFLKPYDIDSQLAPSPPFFSAGAPKVPTELNLRLNTEPKVPKEDLKALLQQIVNVQARATKFIEESQSELVAAQKKSQDAVETASSLQLGSGQIRQLAKALGVSVPVPEPAY